MKPRFFSSRSRVLFASGIASTLFFAHTASAQWLGLGAPAGIGTEITNTANWTGSVINGDFSTINTAGTYALTLSADQAFTNGSTGAGTAVSTTLSAASASGATTLTVVDATGIKTGYKVGGTGTVLGSYVKKVDGNVITISFPLSAATGTGNYSFTRPALDFNFGYSPVDLVSLGSGVDLQIGSSVPGTPRTISIAGTTLSTQRTAPANNVTFSQDIAFNQTAETAWGRMTGDAVTPGQTSPTVTINGPVNLGTFSTSNSKLVLEGGYLTINGVISGGDAGTGAAINFGSSDSAGILTLTNPNNSFGRNIANNGDGGLVADSVKAIGNIGELSALGTGSASSRISSNGKTITLKGFTVPQTTNREISLGNGRLNNDGGAPLYLTGPVLNNTTTGNSSFGGSYTDYENPNVISGLMSDPTARTTGVLIGGGVWSLTNPANSFTRALGVSGGPGILRTDTLPNIGEGGPLGLSNSFTMSTAVTNFINFIEYVGTAYDSTDRGLAFSGNINGGGGNGLLANGLGAMEFTGPFSHTMVPNVTGTTTTATRILNLEGSGDGILSGAGTLVDNVPATGTYTGKIAKLGVAKRGAGTWTLSGSGLDYSGTTNVSAGKLVFDFTNSPQLSGPLVGNMAIDFGSLEFRAKPTGVTTYNFPGQIQIGVATNFGPTNLTVNANGGDGFHLGIGTLQATSSVIRTELIDTSSSAGNQVTVNAFGAAMKIVKGIIQNNASTDANGRASIILKDSQGYAFPTLAGGAAPGLLTRITTEDMPVSGSSAEVNYLLDDPGTTTLTGNFPFSTITVDSTADDITLDLAGFNLAPSGAGRGVLFRGANDVTLTSTGGFASGSAFIHNYLEPGATLTIGANFSNNQPVILGGNGFTNYTGVGVPFPSGSTNASDTNGLGLTGGIFRFSTDQDLTSEANTKIRLRAINTVIEIGADLNGATEGDFTNGVGKDPLDTSGNTNLNRRVVFYGNSGLSAANGKRVVNFISEGVQQPLVWGSNGFLTGSDNDRDNGYPLKLSSPRADGTIEIKNPIDLNAQSTHGRRRTVEVANGSAAIDAELSGVLSGGAGLVKTGAGTLLLSGVNTYRGDTHVRAGKLLLGNGASAGTGRLFIDGSGALGGTGSSGSATVSGNLEVEINGATSSKLTVNGDLAIGGSTLTVAVLSPATQASYVIAEYTGTLSGTFASVPSGYTVTYDGGNKRILLNVEGGPPPNAFNTYMQVAFPGNNNPAVVGASADADNDGLKNAIEFVLNSNPNSGSQSNLPKARKDGNNIVFEFTRRKDAATAGYPSTVQVSSTLLAGSWTDVTAGISTVNNPGNPTVLEDVTVTIPIPGGDTKLFARLKVEIP